MEHNNDVIFTPDSLKEFIRIIKQNSIKDVRMSTDYDISKFNDTYSFLGVPVQNGITAIFGDEIIDEDIKTTINSAETLENQKQIEDQLINVRKNISKYFNISDLNNNKYDFSFQNEKTGLDFDKENYFASDQLNNQIESPEGYEVQTNNLATIHGILLDTIFKSYINNLQAKINDITNYSPTYQLYIDGNWERSEDDFQNLQIPQELINSYLAELENYIQLRHEDTNQKAIYPKAFELKTKQISDIYSYDSNGAISSANVTTLNTYITILKTSLEQMFSLRDKFEGNEVLKELVSTDKEVEFRRELVNINMLTEILEKYNSKANITNQINTYITNITEALQNFYNELDSNTRSVINLSQIKNSNGTYKLTNGEDCLNKVEETYKSAYGLSASETLTSLYESIRSMITQYSVDGVTYSEDIKNNMKATMDQFTAEARSVLESILDSKGKISLALVPTLKVSNTQKVTNVLDFQNYYINNISGISIFNKARQAYSDTELWESISQASSAFETFLFGIFEYMGKPKADIIADLEVLQNLYRDFYTEIYSIEVMLSEKNNLQDLRIDELTETTNIAEIQSLLNKLTDITNGKLLFEQSLILPTNDTSSIIVEDSLTLLSDKNILDETLNSIVLKRALTNSEYPTNFENQYLSNREYLDYVTGNQDQTYLSINFTDDGTKITNTQELIDYLNNYIDAGNNASYKAIQELFINAQNIAFNYKIVYADKQDVNPHRVLVPTVNFKNVSTSEENGTLTVRVNNKLYYPKVKGIMTAVQNNSTIPTGGAVTNYVTNYVADALTNFKKNSLDGAFIPGTKAADANQSGKYLWTVSGGANLKANKVYGAVFNDYAEYRNASAPAGRVVVETGHGDLVQSTTRLQLGANIVSDTFGFAIGETKENKTPIAVCGRVLAYPCEPKEKYTPGAAVCSGPNGTVSLMTRGEIKEYPDAILGYVSEIPVYDTWGEDNIPVNGRIWIKIK